MMFSKLYLYAGIVIAAVLAYFGWKAKVKSDAVNDERAKRQKDVLDAYKDRQKSDVDIDSLTDEQLRDRLHDPNSK